MSALDSIVSPVVQARGGKAFANSRDVAAFFGKQHGHVMRDIDNLIASEPGLGLSNFGYTPYVEPSNGQTYRSFDMDRDGFTLLAMGFTGPKALKWKLRYIEAFNQMEAELRAPPSALPDLSDPVVLVQLLTEHTGKRIEAERRADRAEREAETMRDDVAALERISKADGSLSITEAAKALQMRPKDLFAYLQGNGWIYKRPGSANWLGYQDKATAALLEHKVTTVLRSDGSEKVTEQVRVTPKGMAKLAKATRAGKLI